MDNRVPVEEFNAALWKRFKGGKIRNVYPMTKYNDIVEKIKAMEDNPPCNIPGEYYLLRKFIVVNVDGKERLSCKPENCTFGINTRDKNISPKKFYVALEEIYNYIDEAHKLVKHGGRDRIVRIIQNQGIVNITRDTVELFLSFCKVCRPRKRESTRKPSSKTVVPSSLHNDRICDSPLNVSSEGDYSERPPIIRNEETVKVDLNQTRQCNSFCSFTRGYIDLIDLSSSPDGEYRFVFLYLDLQTCFSVLYPMRCKCIYEIVSHLLNIFTLIGPPQILHSSFEQHFLLTIIQDL
ncbi:KRAB-A domain-containing protein 2, partial [Stegodyphus mimosarum]